jgi:hypothetical protein
MCSASTDQKLEGHAMLEAGRRGAQAPQPRLRQPPPATPLSLTPRSSRGCTQAAAGSRRRRQRVGHQLKGPVPRRLARSRLHAGIQAAAAGGRRPRHAALWQRPHTCGRRKAGVSGHAATVGGTGAEEDAAAGMPEGARGWGGRRPEAHSLPSDGGTHQRAQQSWRVSGGRVQAGKRLRGRPTFGIH